MNAEQKEILIIKLNDERIYLEKLLKEYEQNMDTFRKRIGEIDAEIKELLK